MRTELLISCTIRCLGIEDNKAKVWFVILIYSAKFTILFNEHTATFIEINEKIYLYSINIYTPINMKKRLLYFFLFNALLLILFACGGVSQQEHDKLKAENELLRKELEEIKFGPDRLLSDAKTYLENKDWGKAKSSISLLKEKHPTSPQALESKELSTQIEKAIKDQQEAEKKAQEAREKAEKEKLANATKKLRTKHDEMRDVTWYYDKNTPQYTNYNSFHLYMGKNKTGKPWLRFRIQYAADD